MKVCTLASISPQFQPSTMCYVETVYHLVRVSGRTIFDLDARLGRSTVSTCGIGEGRDPGEMKASVHVVTTVCHVRGVGRSRRPCIAVCLRNLLNSRPRAEPVLKGTSGWDLNSQPRIFTSCAHSGHLVGGQGDTAGYTFVQLSASSNPTRGSPFYIHCRPKIVLRIT